MGDNYPKNRQNLTELLKIRLNGGKEAKKKYATAKTFSLAKTSESALIKCETPKIYCVFA